MPIDERYWNLESVVWHEAGHAVMAELLGVRVAGVVVRSREASADGITLADWSMKGVRPALISLAGPVSDAMQGLGAEWLSRGPPPVSEAPQAWRLELRQAAEKLNDLAPRLLDRQTLLHRLWSTTTRLLCHHEKERRYVAEELQLLCESEGLFGDVEEHGGIVCEGVAVRAAMQRAREARL